MTRHHQKGFTLLELMIASALGLMIILGVFHIFMANIRAYTVAESTARLQESGRFAIEYLSSAVRGAGSYGCLPGVDLSNGHIQSHVDGVRVAAIQGFEKGEPQTNWVDQPDELTLLRAVGSGFAVSSVTLDTEQRRVLNFSESTPFNGGDVLLVGTCEVADIIRVAGEGRAAQTATDATGNLRDNYNIIGSPVQAYRLQSQRFYVQNNTLFCDGCDGANRVAIVDEIETVQFRFGVDIDADNIPDFYVPSSELTAGQRDNVVAIQISVLVQVAGQNSNNVTSEPQPFIFMGQRYTPSSNDLTLRRSFETTVTLRNGVQ